MFLQIAIHQLEDQSKLPRLTKHVNKAHDVLMSELLQDCNLSNGGARHTVLAVANLHLLQGSELSCMAAPRFSHLAISSFAQDFCDVILVPELALSLVEAFLGIQEVHVCHRCHWACWEMTAQAQNA